MTITVTPEPLFAPPRMAVTVALTAGYVMAAVELWRNDSTGRSLVRSQPSAGFDTRTIYDYECPYGESVTYDWEATYTNPAGYVTLFNELWASLASWTNATDWNVSGGKLRNTSGSPTPIYRNVASAKYRVTIGSLDFVSGTGAAMVELRQSATSLVRLINEGAGAIRVQILVAGVTVTDTLTAIGALSPIKVDFNATTVTVSGTGGELSSPANLALARITMSYSGPPIAANLLKVGAIKVESYPAPTSIEETSAVKVLSVNRAWMIAPQAPAKSFPLGKQGKVAGIETVEPVQNGSNTTVHKILGSRTPITVTSGERSDDIGSMDVLTFTADEASALRALLRPDLPVLIQVPAGWGTDFESGFYQVGDTKTGRVARNARHPARRHTLPLTKVQSPIVDVEDTGWSWAAVLVDFASWNAQRAVFDTWSDLQSNTRS